MPDTERADGLRELAERAKKRGLVAAREGVSMGLIAFVHEGLAWLEISDRLNAFAEPRRPNKAAIARDSHLSLRECARKHGVGVGIVRGIRALAQQEHP